MSVFETFRLALKSIWNSKMRTFLTMLGIIIGITAVIVIVGLGNGMQNYMTESFSSLGTNTLTVRISGRGTSRSISLEQVYDIAEKNPRYFTAVTPTVTVSGGVKVGTENLAATTATGVSEEYLEAAGFEVAQGRELLYMDVLERKAVCVIGAYVNQEYFNGRALGQTLRLGGEKMTIVGILAQEADEPEEGSSDDRVYLPYSTANRLSGRTTYNSYTFYLTDEELAAPAKTVVENALYEVFRSENTYTVSSMTEVLDMMNQMIGVVITVLTIIAGISLLVGGVGIMNIMLVSVTERTREIGIRKALGAKEGTILRQFVMEAATTSGLGGILGIALGYLLSSAATVVVTAMLETELTVTPTLSASLLAVGISVAIGVLFGYLPARKAAKMNPIDALRYE